MKDILKNIIKNNNFYNILEYINKEQYISISNFLQSDTNNFEEKTFIKYLREELKIKNYNDVYHYFKFNIFNNDKLINNYKDILLLIELSYNISDRFSVNNYNSKIVVTEPKILDLPKFYPETYLEILKLINESKNSIKILTAFIEPRIIKLIFNELEKKINENPNYDIKICIGYWKSFQNEISNTQTSVKWIQDNYKHWKNCQIKYFKKMLDKEFNSTHAKLIIVDDVKAYFGSANLTDSSMKNSFELGIISNDNYVKDLILIYNKIWQSGSFIPKNIK